MAVSNILSKFSTKEKAEEQFLAIEIGSETVTTAVWQVVTGKTQIVSMGTTQEWEIEKDSIEKLLVAIDTSLEKTLLDLKEEPNKVIFGLQESWVEKDGIAKKYAATLKSITEKFEFEPVGFVVTTEALLHLLKTQEGTPPTAILIRVSESEAQITLVNLGRVVGSQTVSRSEDIGADVEEGLARFKTAEKYPSRMLLVDSDINLDALKQDILSYNWLEKLPFLHFPKVEVLESDITIKAVAIAGGAEAAKALGFDIAEEEPEETEDTKDESQDDESEDSQTEKPGEEQDVNEDGAILAADQIGFVSDEDVSMKPQSEHLKEEPKQQNHEVRAEEALFDEEEQSELSQTQQSMVSRIKSILPSGFSLSHIKFPRFGGMLGSKNKAILSVVIGFSLLLVTAGAFGYWMIPKATLVLYVSPRTFDKTVQLTIDPSAGEVVAHDKRIPGKILKSEVSGTKERQTTGTRLVGEKATGEVVIYNKTSATKTFPAGTALVGPDNLEYTLNSQVQVASASAEESDEALTTVFGKATAAVTAEAIGTEFNLPANTEFQLTGFSQASYNAKNEQDLMGGTSREVQAIAQDDVDGLLADLEEELREQASSELENREGQGKKVLTQGAIVETISQNVSGEEGDEAQTVSAELSVQITTIAYDERDFREIVMQEVFDAIPQGFELREEESSFEVEEAEFLDETIDLSIVYKAVLTPKINEQEIKDYLKGRYPDLVKEYLESLPNFARADIAITPDSMPAKLKKFPKRDGNITIEVRVEEEQ